ncbi:MAG: serine/threonine protein kinase [Zoogloeaceae bacterium]|jgi:hypothetical protein|nr:serine/threonine protein kinase [Zoogloeaceae bacterium]
MRPATFVRVCPACETENPPERMHCRVCATSLADVDFHRRAATPEPETPSGTNAAAAAAAARGETQGETRGETQGETRGETQDEVRGKAQDEARDAGVSAVAARHVNPDAVPEVAPAVAARIAPDAPAGTVRCPAPDCGQSNPPGSARCLYCDSPLPSAEARPAAPAPVTSAFPVLELARPELDHVPAATPGAPTLRIVLPRRLATRFRVLRELAATGSESDLLIVTPAEAESGPRRVLKLYRRGIRPDANLLARVTGAGPHVVQLIEYGVDEGLAWTLMEYCAGGNLRDILEGRLVDREFFTRLARELSAGVNALHARGILHRDLKPENVLVRKTSPLALALTDFGIASLAEGTRLFTDNARTVKYAAPEALTGVLDAKADWWSVGMILLEAASGRHPFDGLSEQVVNHHLATRPVAVAGLVDARMEKLCRGLLLRDPDRRWGAPEVARWLAGDTTLPMPVETGAERVRPFRLGAGEARDAGELAALFASGPEQWRQGMRDLQNGLVQTWIKEELHDFGLLRAINALSDVPGERAERRFLRFLLAAAPDLPPCWLGRPAGGEALEACARQACADTAEARDARAWLVDLYENSALSLFGATHPELTRLSETWRQTMAEIRHVWETMKKTSRGWMRQIDAEESGAVNFDALIYGSANTVPLPAPARLHPRVILALTQAGFLDALEKDIGRVAMELADDAPWFAEMATAMPTGMASRAARLIAAGEMAEIARASAVAVREKRRRQSERQGRSLAAARAEIEVALQPFLHVDDALDAETILELRATLENFRQRIQAMRESGGFRDAAFTRQINTLEYRADMLEAAFDNISNRGLPFEIAGKPAVMLGVIAGGILFFLLLFATGQPSLPLLCVGGAVAVAVAWLYWRWRFARRQAEWQFRQFRRACLDADGNP